MVFDEAQWDQAITTILSLFEPKDEEDTVFWQGVRKRLQAYREWVRMSPIKHECAVCHKREVEAYVQPLYLDAYDLHSLTERYPEWALREGYSDGRRGKRVVLCWDCRFSTEVLLPLHPKRVSGSDAFVATVTKAYDDWVKDNLPDESG